MQILIEESQGDKSRDVVAFITIRLRLKIVNPSFLSPKKAILLLTDSLSLTEFLIMSLFLFPACLQLFSFLPLLLASCFSNSFLLPYKHKTDITNRLGFKEIYYVKSILQISVVQTNHTQDLSSRLSEQIVFFFKYCFSLCMFHSLYLEFIYFLKVFLLTFSIISSFQYLYLSSLYYGILFELTSSIMN